MLLGVRDQLVARRTQLSNTIRGYAAEFGLIEAKGLEQDRSAPGRGLPRDDSVPGLGRASCLQRSLATMRGCRSN